jgi:hypothetical protein
MKRTLFPYFVTAMMIIGLSSLSFLITTTNKQTALRSQAQMSYIEPQCTSRGTVQFAISFTNPESYPIDLLADILLQDGSISRSYPNIQPGQTETDIIKTDLTALSNTGDVAFTWSPVGSFSDSNNSTASFNTLTCSSSSQSMQQSTSSAQMPALTNTPSVTPPERSTSEILDLQPVPKTEPKQPDPVYKTLISGITNKVNFLIANLFRFFSAFN